MDEDGDYDEYTAPHLLACSIEEIKRLRALLKVKEEAK